jgi:HK97 family phage major capsid protein
MRVFEAFKDENDRRLGDIEKRGSADVVTEDKVARIERRLDELTLKSSRPAMARDGAVRLAGEREHKSAFEAYVRSGEASALRALEAKSMTIGSGPGGGYLVPTEVEQAIGRRLSAISPVRSLASVRTISSNVYKKPFMTAGPAVGWVAETAARTETTAPVLDELSFPAMELYAMPAATAALLEDAAVNIDEWIAQEVELTLFECPGFAVALFHAVWSGEPQIVNGLVNLSALIMAYMAARFGVLGVYVSGRSREKRAASGPDGAGVIGGLVKALARKK